MIDGISGDILKQYIEKIEKLEQEKKEIIAQIKDIYAGAKSDGLKQETMRQIIKIRKMKKEDIYEQETLFEIYKKALGMDSDVS
ncbi:MAG: DUF2312 domain-containing protein [Candidatus Midichloria sp.]|nr:MAG: DUF2312 domain-containing protein [Candidatus Midichloria sp.]